MGENHEGDSLRSMTSGDTLCRATIFVVMFVSVGCNASTNNDGNPPKAKPLSELAEASRQKDVSEDFLETAERMLRIGDLDAAAESASKALLQAPESPHAILVAAEVEAARGNHEASADLAGSIEIGSPFGKRAIGLRYQQLLELDRYADAAESMIAAADAMPDDPDWRHGAWSALNRIGRREEASLQADLLCRGGGVSEVELLSLLRRGESFPFRLPPGEAPEKHFEPGLGMARWHFTQRDYRLGLQELSTQRDAGFSTPAASCALTAGSSPKRSCSRRYHNGTPRAAIRYASSETTGPRWARTFLTSTNTKLRPGRCWKPWFAIPPMTSPCTAWPMFLICWGDGRMGSSFVIAAF